MRLVASPSRRRRARELPALPWRRFVIWGQRLHEHTHSYIHEAFLRGARWLGLDAVWLADEPADPADFARCLFLTVGLADRHLPIRRDCFYVVHNWDPARPSYAPVLEWRNYVALQVYTKEALGLDPVVLDRRQLAYFVEAERELVMPWATDSLPDEIERQQRRLPELLRQRNGAAWVGTIGEGKPFGNAEQVGAFRLEAERLGLPWTHRVNLGRKEHVRLIERALLAPAIVGSWQLEHGYVPCRIFKNVSYGQLALTNSPVVAGLLPPGLCLQDEDTAALCRAAYEWNVVTAPDDRVESIRALMGEVRERHTYASRIRILLDVIAGL